MTNNIQEIYFDTIIPSLKVMNSKQAYQKISNHVSNLIGVSENTLLNIMLENDALNTSGIGNGVAIAHAKLPRLTRPMIVYAKLDKEIEFNALDDEPVNMVCLVLSPEFEGPKHLQRLSMVTRFFKDNKTRAALEDATDYDSIRMAVKLMNEMKKAA